MGKILQWLFYIFIGLIALAIILFLWFQLSYFFINDKAKGQLVEKKTLTEGGQSYKDLNTNDVYEDVRQPIEARVADLISQMSVEEKVGLMWHPPIGMGQTGEVLGKPNLESFFFGSSYDYLVNKKLRHFNLFPIAPPQYHAQWYNALQKIAEQDRLGIPVTISSDPRHGHNNFLEGDLLKSEFSKWPEPIGFAAINDSLLTVEFGKIANEEFRAVGIRTALHPMADIATEPRWARINGTFGEDAHLSAKITAAYINGFQQGPLNANSVACMTKHWAGGGPQADGEDAHFKYGKDQVYPGDNFKYHLIPFEAAFDAHTAMLMPYYGVPVGQTSEDVPFGFNKEMITDLLRKEYGYDGIVCSDWGIIEGFGLFGREIVAHKGYNLGDIGVKGRIQKAVDAGLDQFGGNSNVDEMLELVKEGAITEARIDESVRRLLRAKFQMGLFDNPYVEEEKATAIIGKAAFVEKGKIAQRRSIVLLKNKITPDSLLTLPLQKRSKIYIENVDPTTASSYATVVDSLEEADFAILRLATPHQPRTGDFIEQMFHQGDLDFKSPEKSKILNIISKKPTVVVLYLDRAAVIPEIAAQAHGLLAEFGAEDDAVLDVIFGDFNPSGKLPIELPSSMVAVEAQKEDVPYDSENPLFPFGHGLNYQVQEAAIAE